MIDRRRATRTGPDEMAACAIAVPPFDARHPPKTLRRPTLQVLMMCVELLSARDAMPASTCLMLRVEVHVVLPAIALCVLTRFCRKRLLGET